MSSAHTIYLPTRAFNTIKRKAKLRARKQDIKLNVAQLNLANEYGFPHWPRLVQSNKEFTEHVDASKTHPIFFWDNKHIDDLEEGAHWSVDRLSLEVCIELTISKPAIVKYLDSLRDDLTGALYRAEWKTLKELEVAADDALFFPPELVFVDGYLIPFEKIGSVERGNESLKKAEAALLIQSGLNSLLDELDDEVHNVVLDFSNTITECREAFLMHVSGWSKDEAVDFIIGQRADSVVLIAPPSDLAELIGYRIGQKSVRVVE